jgi:hypothetical protein
MVAAIFGAALLMLGLGCQESSDALAVKSAGAAVAEDTVEVTALRELAFQYWNAVNDYDIDSVLAFLESTYRAQREEQIREDIARLEQFSVELGVTEHLPPHLAVSGQWEMYLFMETPIDTRRLRMAYLKDGDRWWITHAEEVE